MVNRLPNGRNLVFAVVPMLALAMPSARTASGGDLTYQVDEWLTRNGVNAASDYVSQYESSRPESFAGSLRAYPMIMRGQDEGAEQATSPSSFNFSRFNAYVVRQFELAVPSAIELGRLLVISGVTSGQKRNPITTENVLAGRRKIQTPGGSYWFPAREDLDTMLSKIDSRLIEAVKVVKGPYTVREGPGLSFYDVELLRAPRYADGYESHGSSVVEYQTNGEQWHGRQSFWGGSYDWGYRVGYGHRTGNDYETGAGVGMPSSYNSRSPDVALGADLTDDSHIDIHYLRLDQTDVEFPGQIFDIDFLVTDSFEMVYVHENSSYYDRLELETWYNHTRFEGDNLRPGKRRQVPELDNFLGFGISLNGVTDVDAMSTGFSLAASWGEADGPLLTAGADFRYIKQQLNEVSELVGFFPPSNKPIPKSHASNPGVFVESSMPISSCLNLRSGARVDWVSMNADESVPGTNVFELDQLPAQVPTTNLEDALGGEFDQHFGLWMAYLALDYQIDANLTATLGAGHSMRPPSMTELYAVQPFLAVMPQFLYNAPFGNPLLDPEELWQIDVGLQAEYCCSRFGVSAFHAWIQDYITYDNFAAPFPGQVSTAIGYVNTELATLAGVEMHGETDWSPWLTSFTSLSYVEGRDHTRTGSNNPIRAATAGFSPFPNATSRSFSTEQHEPLPVIPPLEGRIGLRFHQPGTSPRWSVEFAARIVDNQDRTAFITLGEQRTPGFTVVDIRAYWQARENLLLTSGVENVGDNNYREHFDPRPSTLSGNFFQPGVNFYFGSELNY